ncbi:transcription factor MYB44-like protein [Tanacetum coccineum]
MKTCRQCPMQMKIRKKSEKLLLHPKQQQHGIMNNTQKKDMDYMFVKERPWSPEEDDMLLNLFEKHGPNWLLICESIPGRTVKSCWSRWEDVHNMKLSLAEGGVRGHQAPSISDMARDNMSSEGTHSYSHDGPAPSWNDLNDRDSSEMMSERDNMQLDFFSDEFERLVEG